MKPKLEKLIKFQPQKKHNNRFWSRNLNYIN